MAERARCPFCTAMVEVTSKDNFRSHKSNGWTCPGSGASALGHYRESP